MKMLILNKYFSRKFSMKKLLGICMLMTSLTLGAMMNQDTSLQKSLQDIHKTVALQLTDLTRALRDVKEAIDTHPEEAQAALDTIIDQVSERAKEYALEIGMTYGKGARESYIQ